MSKIVTAINTMITNGKLISNVIKGKDDPSELFFLYDKKHKWSIKKDHDNEIFLHYYPGDDSLEKIAQWSREAREYELGNMVTYLSSDIGSREAYDSFNELHKLAQEKLFGMDQVLNDIIGHDWL